MIYVDDPMTINLRYPNWCHMWSSTGDQRELHAFAARLGLKRNWFQVSHGISGEFPHYDISPGKRALALHFGAEYKSLKEYVVERIKERKT